MQHSAQMGSDRRCLTTYLGSSATQAMCASWQASTIADISGETNPYVEYRQGTRHADVDTVEDRDGVIVTESLVASSELYCLCMYQYIV